MEKITWSHRGHTASDTLIFLLALILLTGALALGLLTLGHLAGRPGESPVPEEKEGRENIRKTSGWLDGRVRSRFQTDFDKALGVADFSRDLWGALGYALFNQGVEGVLIGPGGMLFTSEEWESSGGGENPLSLFQWEQTILSARDELAGEGVELILVLVPAKASVYDGLITAYPRPDGLKTRYGDWLDWIDRQDLPAPDLLSRFRWSRTRDDRTRDDLLYFKTDTHWNGRGASLAADAVADTLIPLARAGGIAFTEFALTEGETQEFEGDLVSFVPGHHWVPGKALGQESYRPLEAVPVNPSGWGLFDTPVIPVALTGTSYSRDGRWNWTDRLRGALSLDVLNLSEVGLGPLKPMEALLDGKEYQETGASFVIWEIPERYLPPRS